MGIQQRCLVLFLGAVNKETGKKYLYFLSRFLKWSGSNDYDDLLKGDEKQIQMKVEDYLIHLKDNHSPNYIPVMMTPIELFYMMNDVNLNSKRLHKMYPTKIKAGGFGAYSKEDIQMMLENTNKKRTRALILFFASTGCRAGAVTELKLKHIENIEDCKSVLVYADSKEEYLTFMTPEASRVFEDYLNERQKDNERLTPDSPAFRTEYQLGSTPAITMTPQTVRGAILMTTKNLTKSKVGSRFTTPTVHGLRKYFNITMKIRDDVNLSLCEKMMGHSVTVGLDNHYLPTTKEQLFKEYQKAIPFLMIDQSKIQELKIKKLQEKNNTVAGLERRIQELEALGTDNEDVIVQLLSNPKLADFIKQKIKETVKQK